MSSDRYLVFVDVPCQPFPSLSYLVAVTVLILYEVEDFCFFFWVFWFTLDVLVYVLW